VGIIARAHQRLYRGERVHIIDLVEYLSDVCRDLQEVVRGIDVRTDMTVAIQIATDRAIPIALIVTELITNAAKHARHDTSAAKVMVRLASPTQESLTLSISDDGLGMPRDFVPEQSKGLGMRIIPSPSNWAARCTSRGDRADGVPDHHSPRSNEHQQFVVITQTPPYQGLDHP
jgi:two-component sensor histidine kinase